MGIFHVSPYQELPCDGSLEKIVMGSEGGFMSYLVGRLQHPPLYFYLGSSWTY
ncbi:unnamed protein product [Brugia timori]|uniref:Uncharacterized protein n=1 Tax=Brugia timori TaxID=42155 RepID=A0A0R3Q8U3_9BILA|nr:unnamed protein product [Brugia timori]